MDERFPVVTQLITSSGTPSRDHHPPTPLPPKAKRLFRYGGENVNFVDAFVVIFVSRVE